MRMNNCKIIVLSLALMLTACGSPEERAAGHLAKSQEFFDAEDYTKAKLEAQNAAQIEPKNAKARFLLAQLAEKEENYREAIGHLQVAVDSDPAFVDARLKLGNYYFLGRAEEPLAEQVDAALLVAPNNADVLLLKARLAFLRGDQPAALAGIDDALKADPGSIDAYLFRAGVFVDQKKYEDALSTLSEATSIATVEESEAPRRLSVAILRQLARTDEATQVLEDLARDYPDQIVYQYGLVQFYRSEGRTDEAEQLLRELVAAEPEDIGRRISLTQFMAAEYGEERGLESLKKSIEDLPDNARLKVALGSYYESRKLYDDARTAYDGAISLEPKDEIGLAARNRLVAIALAEQDLDEARSLVDGILEDEGDNVEALLVRAAFRYTEEDFNAAVADLRVVLRKDEGNERALLLIARSHVRAGDSVLAQDAYRQLLAVNENHPSAGTELAVLIGRQGDTGEAVELLTKQVEINPTDTAARSTLVQGLLALGDVDAAESEARKLLESDADDALAEFQLGRVMQAQQNSEEAIAAYKRSIEARPNAAEPMQNLIALLNEGGRSGEAIEFLENHLKTYPDQVLPRYLLGSSLARVGRAREAEKQFRDIIEAQPEAVRAYAALAALYEGDVGAREEIYKSALAANPGNAAIALMLGSDYERAKRFDDSIALYEEMIESNPDNAIIANNLAALMLDHRDDEASYQRALEIARRFRDSQQPAFADTLCWAYYRTGDFTNAVRHCEIAVAGAGQIPLLRYHLGMAYAAAQNPVGARQELTKAIEEAQSEFDGIDEARATLEKLGGA